MTPYRFSLRTRVATAFGAFSLVVSLLYVGVLSGMINLVEDAVFVQQFKLALDAASHDPPDGSSHIRPQIWRGLDQVPEPYKAHLEGIEPGIHELDFEDTEVLIARRVPSDGSPDLYAVFITEPIEPSEQWRAPVTVGMVLAALLIVLLAVVVGYTATRQVIAPLARLADLVEQHGVDKLPEDFAEQFTSDEVGLVAAKLQLAGKRVHDAMERERRFSRYASHELRSPVTIIQGAMELIEVRRDALPSTVSRPLARIDRAAQEMARIIDIFLWYGGGRQQTTVTSDVDVAALVHNLIEVHGYLLSHKDVTPQVVVHGTPRLQVNTAVLTIVLGNLLSNAFRFTHHGTVTVSVYHDHVEVADSGEGIAADELQRVFDLGVRGQGSSSGYGLGLSIVRDLCDESGWSVTVDSTQGDGTQVTLWFTDVSQTSG